MPELTFLTATELMAKLRAGETSSRELLDLYLERIDRLGGELNAVVTVDVERARAEADAADARRAAGDEIGPLHGLPMTVKDTFETAGMRTTAGAPFLADYVPDRDAVIVARLRDAGAVIFGKTNLPLMAADGQSYNPVHGTTGNPWDLSRSPGGSSGGSAAALAAGMTSLEVGSDISGSVRHPAAFSGVYGHKPSYGIVPLRGHIPGPPGTLAEADMNVIGPLARGIDDLELALDVIAGPHGQVATAWRLELPPARKESLADYRIAVWLDDPACRVDSEIGAVLRQAADALDNAGAQLVERPGPVPLADAIRVHRMLLMAVAASGVMDDDYAGIKGFAASLSDDDRSDVANHARWITADKRAWNAVNEERARMRTTCAEFFTEFDALLCPAVPCPAVPHDQSEPSTARTIQINGETRQYWDQVNWIGLASAVGLPAGAVPLGLTESGLPAGAQIVGPYLEDRTVIDVGRKVTEVTGGFQAPPAFTEAVAA